MDLRGADGSLGSGDVSGAGRSLGSGDVSGKVEVCGLDGRMVVRVRHRAALVPARYEAGVLRFDEPMKVPAAGQSVVFYGGDMGEVCLGGGIVE